MNLFCLNINYYRLITSSSVKPSCDSSSLLFLSFISEEDENEEFEDMLNSMRDVLVSTGKVDLSVVSSPLLG